MRRHWKMIKSSKGFTFYEIILVIVIMAILTLGGITTYRNNQRQLAHKNAIDKVVQMIQEARNLAINSKLYEGYSELGSPSYDALWERVVPSGYGVRIMRPHSDGTDDKNTVGMGGKVELFVNNRYYGGTDCADLDIPSGGYFKSYPSTTPGTTARCNEISPFDNIADAPDIILKTYEIPEDIKVQINAKWALTIMFTPPFGDASIYMNFNATKLDLSESTGIWQTDSNTAAIRITSSYTDASQTIYINRIGGNLELSLE